MSEKALLYTIIAIALAGMVFSWMQTEWLSDIIFSHIHQQGG